MIKSAIKAGAGRALAPLWPFYFNINSHEINSLGRIFIVSLLLSFSKLKTAPVNTGAVV